MVVCLYTQLFRQAWDRAGQASVVGLDFQVQNVAISTNPTVFGSNETLIPSTLLISHWKLGAKGLASPRSMMEEENILSPQWLVALCPLQRLFIPKGGFTQECPKPLRTA